MIARVLSSIPTWPPVRLTFLILFLDEEDD
jgi:hypothetical protein